MAKGSVLITGANGGLGSAFVSQFLKSPYAKDYRGIYTVRNPTTATGLQAVVKQAPEGHAFETLALDLSSLEKIRATAKDINARVANGTLEPIRALVLNAAFQEANGESLVPKTYTNDGYEAAFAINYLANFLFVLLILQSMDKEHGRIVMISSGTHDAYNPRNMNNFKDEKYKIMYTDTESLAKGISYTDGGGFDAGMRRYGASKLLMVMFMCVYLLYVVFRCNP
jgi:NAD(P)-dependent dehydrogenase (short-subunit alcohol dehydrogenase family)